MDKKTYKEEMKKRMENFKKAYEDLVELFEDEDNEANDYIIDNFPFEKSFDEYLIGIYDWVNSTEEKLDKGE